MKPVLAVAKKAVIVAEGTPESLGNRDRSAARIRFNLPHGVRPSDLPVNATTMDGRVCIETSDEVPVLHRLTEWSLNGNHPLPGLVVERLSLEDVYLQLTGNQSDAR